MKNLEMYKEALKDSSILKNRPDLSNKFYSLINYYENKQHTKGLYIVGTILISCSKIDKDKKTMNFNLPKDTEEKINKLHEKKVGIMHFGSRKFNDMLDELINEKF